MRQVVKPRKSESDKAPVKPSPEDIEEFGEDKKEKQSDTTIVSGAKTGKYVHICHKDITALTALMTGHHHLAIGEGPH